MGKREFHGVPARSAVNALSCAAANDNIRAMKLQLADGTDIDAQNSDGDTALSLAARLRRVRATRFLVAAGADLNVTGWLDMTPLMCACARGGVKGNRIALMLVEAGADVRYAPRPHGITALHEAARICAPKVIQALLDRGAPVDGPRWAPRTPLMFAAQANNVPALKVLIANGADPSRKCRLPWARGLTAEGLAEYDRKKAAVAYLRGIGTTITKGRRTKR